MTLSCPINDAHPTAPDLLENFIIAEAPLRVLHLVFGQDRFK